MGSFLSIPWVWNSIIILYTLVILSIIVVVVSENRNPVKSLAWVTVLLVVPGIGLILYIVFGRNIQNKRVISRRNRRRLRRQSRRALRGARAGAGTSPTVPTSDIKIPSPILKDASSSVDDAWRPLQRLTRQLCGSPYLPDNNVEVFSDGSPMFDALLRDINAATSYINIQYYIIAGDDTARRLADALCAKARAGIKVRVIYDHVGSFRAPRRFWRQLHDAGVEVYPFFKVTFPPFGTRINCRNHRKICIIDGHTGYIGGMNIADRYLLPGPLGIWRDMHLRLQGPAVVSLQMSFAVDWNFMGKPLLDDPLPAPVLPLPSSVINPVTVPDAAMQLVVGGPTSPQMNMTLVFLKIISMARRRLWLQTPYFLPTEGLLQALQTASLAGVDVRLMLPRRSDSDMLRWASNSYVSQCLQSGIKVYFFTRGMLHSKAIIVDDDLATVGSSNFDFRSFEHNFEANMLVYSAPFNTLLRQIFLRDQADSQRVTPALWRQRSLRSRALESIMRLLAPIL